MRWKLFLDDVREVWNVYPDFPDDFLVARNISEVVRLIDDLGCPSFVSFDHDLGEHETGYEVAQMLVEMDMDQNGSFMPEDFDFAVHSANPIGRSNIENYMKNWIEFKRRNQK